MTRTKLEPIDRDIALILREDLLPEAQGQALARFAYEQRDEAAAINEQALGYEPHQDTFVDGARASSLDRVKADSRIVVEFDIVNDVFAWIDLMLISHAPVRSGRFRKSFIFLVDGVESDPQAMTPPDASEFVYVNTQPYARPIERGLSKQAPDGVFHAVAVMAAKRFGNIVKIRFSYRAVVGGRVATSRSIGSKRETQLRQPAIIITR